MGSFRVQIEIGDLAGGRFENLEALVDTGATYTWVPRDLLERLGVRPDEERPFVLADGRQVTSSPVFPYTGRRSSSRALSSKILFLSAAGMSIASIASMVRRVP